MKHIENLIVWMLKLYRKWLSPMKIRCCRFYPSCSEYIIEAIEKEGIFSGSFKGLKRILRCHPFSRGGYDPVR